MRSKNITKYFQIQKDGGILSEGAESPGIYLRQFIECVQNTPGYKWVEITPACIENSDGSSSYLSRHGLMLPNESRDDKLRICYEFDGGICVHADGSEALEDYCELLAERLCAKLVR